MRFTIEKRDLTRVVQRAARVTTAKSTMPILSNVHLSVAAGVLTVTGTDLYTMIQCTTGALKSSADGTACVPAKELLARLKVLPNGAPIDVASDDAARTLTLASGAAKLTLRGMVAEDFPPVGATHTGPFAFEHTMPAETLVRLFDATLPSVSTDETRPHLNSIRIEVGEAFYRAVSTDGHRLTKIDLRREAPSAPKAGMKKTRGAKTEDPIVESFLFSLSAATEIARAFKVGDVRFTVTSEKHAAKNRAVFRAVDGDTTIETRLVDATFPPYPQVIPRDGSQMTYVDLPRQAFVDAVKAAASAASDRTGGIKLTLTPGKLTLAASNTDSGDGEVSIDLPNYREKHAPIGFNNRYLVQACEQIGDDTITLGLSAELDPATFTKSGADGEEYCCVVMPMRI